jgi:hypothetical protein
MTHKHYFIYCIRSTQGLRERQSQPELANQGVALSDNNDDDDDGPLAHPLHRLCDYMFAGRIRDEQAVD